MASPGDRMSPPDWSVLTHASREALGTTLAGVVALGRARRAALGRAIGVKVLTALKQTIHPWFSPGLRDHAEVDVVAATAGERSLVLHFVADHYNSHSAWSGSDWADHFFSVGEAELDGGTLRAVTFALERQVHLTEHEEEHYDQRLFRALLCAEQRARVAGLTPDRRPFDEAVAAVRAASAARAAAANARARPPPSPPSPPPSLRCPRCGAREVESDLLFEAWALGCRACGHHETFMGGPDGDSDDHWYA